MTDAQKIAAHEALVDALRAALEFQVANIDTPSEFYRCRTDGRELPTWVTRARAALSLATEGKA